MIPCFIVLLIVNLVCASILKSIGTANEVDTGILISRFLTNTWWKRIIIVILPISTLVFGFLLTLAFLQFHLWPNVKVFILGIVHYFVKN